MNDQLSAQELVDMVKRVFAPGEKDKKMVVIVDLPDRLVADGEVWRKRREMSAHWVSLLENRTSDIDLEEVRLFLYGNVHANNADLPDAGSFHDSNRKLPLNASEIKSETMFEEIFNTFQIIVAPTQFSATAPLKVAAKKYGFKAATMPGFTAEMIPALRLDYGVIGLRVDRFKKLLDAAISCHIDFIANGERHSLDLDLRHREAHASGGVFSEGGTAGNLPSGESYIVPYEGEIEGDISRSSGEIPVQFGNEVVIYKIENNRAIEVVSSNAASSIESEKLRQEPAYGNLAELGLGVLSDFGLTPTGQLLLDEKLGLHIAFGRSDHFGGQVGPTDFSSPDRVIHIDRVYTKEIQPLVSIEKALLMMDSGEELVLMRNGAYVVKF